MDDTTSSAGRRSDQLGSAAIPKREQALKERLRLRQIAFVAEKLGAAADELCAVLGIEVAFRDPGVGKWGLENVVCPLGGGFLEIVAPKAPNTSAGRYLTRRKGDGGYMIIMQSPDALLERQRVAGLGVRAVATADRETYLYTHFHPSDLGGFLLSIDSILPPTNHLERYAPWPPAGPDWQNHRREQVCKDIVGVELQSDDPEGLAKLWARVLDLPARKHEGIPRIALANARLRFVKTQDGRGPGIGALDIAVNDRAYVLAEAAKRGLKNSDDCVTVCGCRINLR